MQFIRFLIAGCVLAAVIYPLLVMSPYIKETDISEGSEIISDFSTTPLHQAAEENDIGKVLQLLSEGKVNLNAINDNGHSALICALMRDYLEVADLLLQNGALITYTFQRKESPKARAAAAAQYPVDLVSNEHLKELGLPPELIEEMTSQQAQDDMVKDMVDLHFTKTTEHAISWCETLEALQLVLQHGGDINYVAGDGYWPLSSFAERGNLPAVKWLLENGATPNNTSTGETAIFKAIYQDHIEMVKELIKYGAEVNVTDVDGCIPLSCSRSLTMAKLLIESGADPTIRDQCDFPCWKWVDDPEAKAFLKASAN